MAFWIAVIIAQLPCSVLLFSAHSRSTWQGQIWALFNMAATDKLAICPSRQTHKNYWARFESGALTMGTPPAPNAGDLA